MNKILFLTLVLVIAASFAYAADKGNPPVAHWRFDEGGGSTAYDESANNYDATLYNHTKFAPGKIGKALQFDGTDDYAQMANNFNSANLSVFAWVNPKAAMPSGWHGIAYTALNNSTGGWWIGFNKGTGLACGFGPSYTPRKDSTQDLPADQWSHVGFTVNDSTKTVTLYYNGQSVGTFGYTSVTNGSNLWIGKGNDDASGDEMWNGYIDDLKIYNYVRTSGQILVDYNAGSAAHLGAGADPNEGNPPAGYWPMDENKDTTVYDKSGNGKDGTTTGCAWAQGKNGPCLSFIGTSDKVQTADPVLTGTGDFTITAWIYPTGTISDPDYIAGNYGTGNPGGIEFYIYQSKLCCYIGSYLYGSTILTPNVWYHAAVTRTSGAVKIYLNGIQDGSGTLNGNITGSRNFAIGNGPDYTSETFEGKIDDVKFYAYPRSAKEIAYDYNKGAPVAHYKFEEGGGAIAKNGYSSADAGAAPVGWWRMDNDWNDSSGNGFNGTATAATFTTGKIGPFAGSFNGSTAHVAIPTMTGKYSNAITIEAWVNHTTTLSWNDIVAGGCGDIIFGFDTTSKFSFGGQCNSPFTPVQYTTSIDGAWHHVAGVYDGSTAKLYVDGVMVTSGSRSGSFSPGALNIGSTGAGNGEFFTGSIDDVRMYNYARTAEQIYNDYKTTHGTLVGGTKFADGKIGKALQFDGTDDYVIIEAPELMFNSGDFSVSLWAKPTVLDGTYDGLITTDTSGDSAWKIFRDAGDQFFRARFGSNVYNYPAVSAGDWHNYGYVKSGTSLILYMDGKQISTNACSATHGVSNTKVVLGSYRVNDAISGTHMYNGFIDDVRIYNYARDINDIKQIMQDYNAGFSARLGAPSAGEKDPWGRALPIAYYKFDENTGVLTQDASEDGRIGALGAGTPANMPSWTQGKNGPCLNFDGSDDYVLTTGSAPILKSLQSFTVTAWVTRTVGDTTTYRGLVSVNAGTDNDYNPHWVFHTYNNSIGFESNTLFAGNTWNAGVAINDGLWHHVAVVVKYGVQAELYVDGLLRTTQAVSSVTFNTETNVRIGRRYYAGVLQSAWSGKIDDVKIYEYARNQAEIAWDYNKGAPVANWKFEEGSGTTLYDDSLNNNHATLVIGGSGSQTTTASAWTNGATGKFGKCMAFDGTDDYVDCGSYNNLNSTEGVTISAWVKPSTLSGRQTIVFKNAPYALSLNGNTIGSETGLYMSGGAWHFFTGSKTFTAGQWHHVALVYDKQNMYIYVNGALDTSVSETRSIQSYSSNMYIGIRDVNTYPFNGLIDDVRIYNYARRPEQVQQDYLNGASTRLGD